MLSSVSSISFNGIYKNSYLKEAKEQAKTNPIVNSSITHSIWGAEGKPVFRYIPYFKGSDDSEHLPIGHERPGKFQLCYLDNISCPSCGKPMMSRIVFDEFDQKLQKTPEKDYIQLLEEYEKYMTPVEANVFTKIKPLSKKHPNKTMNELLFKLRDEELPKLEAIQLSRLNEMKKCVNLLPKNEKKKLVETLVNAENRIKARSPKHPFRRKDFIAAIDELRIRNIETKQKLVSTAKLFPSSNESECAWIVKYSSPDKKHQARTNKEIAGRFLCNSKTNTDHMKAQDLNGEDVIQNYMAMHSGCNTEKANKSFVQWFNEKPEERSIYIQKYFDKVQDLIDNNELDDPRYLDYVKNANETIKEISYGKIDFEPVSQE